MQGGTEERYIISLIIFIQGGKASTSEISLEMAGYPMLLLKKPFQWKKKIHKKAPRYHLLPPIFILNKIRKLHDAFILHGLYLHFGNDLCCNF